MVSCLLTTQQNSSPGSPISRFCSLRPFPLTMEVCQRQRDLASFSRRTLQRFGGIRRSNTISKELEYNLQLLEAGDGWRTLLAQVNGLRGRCTEADEREVARYVAREFKGFGPKQSRNLLQHLTLTRFVLPIDSRVTRWLNDHVWPFALKASLLADEDYYEWIEDGLQTLCRKADVLPCILDAAIFSSMDRPVKTDRPSSPT